MSSSRLGSTLALCMKLPTLLQKWPTHRPRKEPEAIMEHSGKSFWPKKGMQIQFDHDSGCFLSRRVGNVMGKRQPPKKTSWWTCWIQRAASGVLSESLFFQALLSTCTRSVKMFGVYSALPVLLLTSSSPSWSHYLRKISYTSIYHTYRFLLLVCFQEHDYSEIGRSRSEHGAKKKRTSCTYI